MSLTPDDLIKLVLAVLVGGIIGLEREYRDKNAGFRTMIFISVGATLFTLLSLKIGIRNDPGRIAAQIVSGVGFLGAGSILRDGNRVTGLTTAAMIWLAAALGMAIGASEILLSFAAVGIISVVLWFFPLIEHRVDRIRDSRTYEVVGLPGELDVHHLESVIQTAGLRIGRRKRIKTGDHVVCSWYVYGTPEKHDAVFEQLIECEGVREVRS